MGIKPEETKPIVDKPSKKKSSWVWIILGLMVFPLIFSSFLGVMPEKEEEPIVEEIIPEPVNIQNIVLLLKYDYDTCEHMKVIYEDQEIHINHLLMNDGKTVLNYASLGDYDINLGEPIMDVQNCDAEMLIITGKDFDELVKTYNPKKTETEKGKSVGDLNQHNTNTSFFQNIY